jgi:hypothetical protein
VNLFCPNHPPFGQHDRPNGHPATHLFGARKYCAACFAEFMAPSRLIEDLTLEVARLKADRP